MATRAKDTTSVVGKEKKAQSSNSSITSTKKTTTTKPSTTTSSTNKPTTSPSEKQVPNYLKPTISSVRLESHSSFKLPRNETPTKPNLNRRRSFDPSSHSRLPKQTHPSLSRTHKALVSPGPRDRTSTQRSSSVPVKTTNISNTSKPTPERLSKTPKEGRTQPLSVKNAKKSSSNVSTTTNKKVITNDASANSTNASKSCDNSTAETTEAIGVEIEPEVKETINEDVGEVEKVENQEELPHQVVDSEHEYEHENDHEHEHDHGEHDQKLEESDQSHVEAENEKVIPAVLEQKEEKIEDDDINQDEGNNNESHPEIDHSTTEEEVGVKEKEQEQGKEEGGIVLEKDHKIETKNEEEVVELKKEGVEEGTSEEVKEMKEKEGGEDEHVQSEVKEEKKVESTEEKQVEANGVVQEKTESSSQISNDVNEDSGSKLVDARKRGVRALAGAFQNVIDHQT